MKIALAVVLAFSLSIADKVLTKTLACPSIMLLEKSPMDDDYLDLNMYAIANNCVILSRNSQVQAMGYDPRNTGEIYQQIVDKRTGKTLFVKKSKIQIEQGGKKSTWRF